MEELPALAVLAVGVVHGAWCVHTRRLGLTAVAVAATALVFGLAPLLWAPPPDVRGGPGGAARTALAYGVVLLFQGGLVATDLVGRLRRTGTSDVPLFLRDALRLPPAAIAATLVLAWGARGLLSLEYGVTISGAPRPASAGELPYLLTTVWTLAEMLLLGVLAWAVMRWQEGGPGRWLAVWVLLAEVVLAFLRGRRALLALVLLAVIAALFGAERVRRRALVVVGAAAAVCLLVLFPLFFGTRRALLTGEGRTFGDVVSSVQRAAESWDQPEVVEQHRANVALRARVIGLVEDLLQQQEKGHAAPMQGAALFDVRAAVPTALLPEKRLWISSEAHVLVHHGLPVRDVPTTWPAYGVADFGAWGGLAAGLLLGWLLRLAELGFRIARRQGLLVVGTAVFATWLSLAIRVELNPSGAWVLVRDSLLLLGIGFALRPFLAREAA